jgi:hypothetical protein
MKATCPECEKPIDLPDEHAGRLTRCPVCDTQFRANRASPLRKDASTAMSPGLIAALTAGIALVVAGCAIGLLIIAALVGHARQQAQTSPNAAPKSPQSLFAATQVRGKYPSPTSLYLNWPADHWAESAEDLNLDKHDNCCIALQHLQREGIPFLLVLLMHDSTRETGRDLERTYHTLQCIKGEHIDADDLEIILPFLQNELMPQNKSRSSAVREEASLIFREAGAKSKKYLARLEAVRNSLVASDPLVEHLTLTINAIQQPQ